MSDLLKERGKGSEADYFRKQDAKLLEKMRERASLDEVATALAAKLRVDDAELVRRLQQLGITHETGTAILLAPLVQVAWAEGRVSEAERATVLEIAESRGLEPKSHAYKRVVEWLHQRPSDEIFHLAMEVMKAGFSVLPPAEREESIKGLVAACRRVAQASGGGLGRLLGMGDGTSGDEAAVLEAISAKLRSGA
jgi:tellurite resistance protein